MFSRSLSLWLAPHRQTEWEGRNGGRVGLLAGGFCCNAAAAALKVLRVKKTHFGEKTSVSGEGGRLEGGQDGTGDPRYTEKLLLLHS